MRWAWSIRVGWRIRVETGQHALWRREILKLSGSGLPCQREQTHIHTHTHHTLTHCMNIHAYIVWQGSLSLTHTQSLKHWLWLHTFTPRVDWHIFWLEYTKSNPLRNKGRFQMRSLKALPYSLLSFLLCFSFSCSTFKNHHHTLNHMEGKSHIPLISL